MPGPDAPDLLLAADQAAAAGGGSDWTTLAFMGVAMVAIMYFMVYRPQQREKAERESLLNSLAKGDAVVTSGGLHGTVVSVEADLVKIDVGGKATVTVDKSAIARKAGTPAAGESKK